MSKRFNGFVLVGLLASLLVFVNCSDDDEITASDLISPYTVANSTWFVFTDDSTSTEYSWTTSGFNDPGSGTYEMTAVPSSGTGQFEIVLTGGNLSYTTYDETGLDITYIDREGTTWQNVGTQSFTVTLYDWPEAGGKVSGIFSGMLEDGSSNTREISGGCFKLKVIN